MKYFVFCKMEPLIYLDNHATTPLDPLVLEAMMPYFTTQYGNASSLVHAPGRAAAQAVQTAREQIAELIGASDPSTLVFTSGATEAINLALKGVFEQYQSKGKHFITCRTEHKAVLDTFEYLRKKGAEITFLEVDPQGRIDLSELRSLIRPDTVMLALMSANNETGVMHPLNEIAGIAEEQDVLFFCDATQSVGKVPIDVEHLGVDLLCMSAHKFYGPKGVGALYIRKRNKRIQLAPLLHGGGQENGLRAGTYSVPNIVGMGAAAAQAIQYIEEEGKRLQALRDHLEMGLMELSQTYVNGLGAPRLPHVSNISFRHIRASTLMTRLPRICMSSGSACVSGSRDPSHVLLAMGHSPEDAFSTVRLSLGRFTTSDEIKEALEKIHLSVQGLRTESPTWQLFERGLIP